MNVDDHPNHSIRKWTEDAQPYMIKPISMSKRNGESFTIFHIPECTYRQHDVYVEISGAVAWSHVIVDLCFVLMWVVTEEGILTTPTQISTFPESPTLQGKTLKSSKASKASHTDLKYPFENVDPV
uniref:Uncharacterized protein n=1 Tax=Oryza sativa subsp. japonica TaxID=39947 RepID=Q69XR9_ORYSJ|nr:hypothetical protein [Oryza sativa Japonica Group]